MINAKVDRKSLYKWHCCSVVDAMSAVTWFCSGRLFCHLFFSSGRCWSRKHSRLAVGQCGRPVADEARCNEPTALVRWSDRTDGARCLGLEPKIIIVAVVVTIMKQLSYSIRILLYVCVNRWVGDMKIDGSPQFRLTRI